MSGLGRDGEGVFVSESKTSRDFKVASPVPPNCTMHSPIRSQVVLGGFVQRLMRGDERLRFDVPVPLLGLSGGFTHRLLDQFEAPACGINSYLFLSRTPD